MRKIRFTEHQIIAVLKSVEAGRTVKDVCREAAISEASLQLESEIWRDGSRRYQKDQRPGGREPASEADVCRLQSGVSGAERRY